MRNGNMLKRVGLPLAVMASSLGLSACGSGDGLKYDNKTEARLQEIIQPEMRRIARAVLSMHRQHPFDFYSDESKDGLTILEADNKQGDTIDVVMRNDPKTDKPNSDKVLFVGLHYELKTPTSDHLTFDEEYQLTAPGSKKTSSMTIGFGDRHDGSNRNGWSGYYDKIISENNVVDLLLSETANTNNSRNGFVIGSVSNNPIPTARYIVSRTRESFAGFQSR